MNFSRFRMDVIDNTLERLGMLARMKPSQSRTNRTLLTNDGQLRDVIIIIIIITYDASKVTLHSKLLQGHCTEFEFDDVHTLYANLAVRR